VAGLSAVKSIVVSFRSPAGLAAFAVSLGRQLRVHPGLEQSGLLEGCLSVTQG